eukprot:TRINITY_DN3540_c0_g1_i8.p1 TRINITY_DN3540_c0_g1~~TRINITY_DN3540_c0_g1_i8.p1  ORF type:complete len:200 (-),score=35.78 TRINITY_DN3540_c0_g1_i8:324-923(-)
MGEVKLDAKIYMKPSEELTDLIQSQPPDSIPDHVAKELKDDRLSVKSIQSLKGLLNKNDKKRLCHALESSEMLLPSPEYPERNPVLEARCQQLRRDQEEREYRRLTKNVGNNFGVSEAPLSTQMKELNAILISLLQFVVSVVCAFAFGYLAPYYFYGTINRGTQILCGTAVAIVVGIADLYFVIRETLHNEGFVLKKID